MITTHKKTFNKIYSAFGYANLLFFGLLILFLFSIQEVPSYIKFFKEYLLALSFFISISSTLMTFLKLTFMRDKEKLLPGLLSLFTTGIFIWFIYKVTHSFAW